MSRQDIIDTIIRALEELQDEYEAQGYQCSISQERPQIYYSRTITTQRGQRPSRTTSRTISFHRTEPNNVSHTVSIFQSDSGLVIFKRKGTATGNNSVQPDEITHDRVKEVVRNLLG